MAYNVARVALLRHKIATSSSTKNKKKEKQEAVMIRRAEWYIEIENEWKHESEASTKAFGISR